MTTEIHRIVDKCMWAMELVRRRVFEKQLQTDRIVCLEY